MTQLPIYILAGSDSQPGPVPESMASDHMLRGYKGAIALPSGDCLVQELIHRVRSTGVFSEPVVVGPAEVYASLVDCRIVDVAGDLSRTLDALRSDLYRQSYADSPVAFMSCDILPTVAEFQSLFDQEYANHSDSVLWGQLTSVDSEDMGASSWKPRYRFRVASQSDPQTLFPGHLVIARPQALRLRLTNHLLQLAYRHRNLSLRRRPIPMIAKGMFRLICEDVRNLFRGQWPTLTLGIPWHCLIAFVRFQRGVLSVEGFSRAVMKVLVHRDFHRNDGSAVVFSVTDVASWAKDIDTTDELEELMASLASPSDSAGSQ